MRGDYRVLSKGPADGRWDLAVLRERYLAGAFNGLSLRFMSPPPFENLDFLAEYTDLAYLEITVEGRLNYDLPAFGLPALKELVLLTKSARRIPGFASPDIIRLGFDDRPGRELVAGLRKLRELLVWRWRGTDLRFLGSPPPPLRVLRIDGMRQPLTLDGIEECGGLAELEIGGSRVQSLRPLRGLTNLRKITIIPAHRATGDACLDLADLTGLVKLEQLVLGYVGKVRSLRPMLDMPALREFRCVTDDIADRDLSPLSKLPPHVHLAGQLGERLHPGRDSDAAPPRVIQVEFDPATGGVTHTPAN
jgi:hypothetical protein